MWETVEIMIKPLQAATETATPTNQINYTGNNILDTGDEKGYI
jgi:hypothetical protein